MCATETIDYEAVLADLRSKRDHLNATIAGIEQLLGVLGTTVGGGQGAPNSSGAQGRPASSHGEAEEQLPKEIQSDTFFGLSAVDGAKKYLKIVKQPATMKAMHDALLAGGYLTQSQNFYANLYTAVMRNRDFQKVGKRWGLAEWYQGRRPPEPATLRRRRKKTRRSKTKGKAPGTAFPKTVEEETKPKEVTTRSA
jgi:hypothetical protein